MKTKAMIYISVLDNSFGTQTKAFATPEARAADMAAYCRLWAEAEGVELTPDMDDHDIREAYFEGVSDEWYSFGENEVEIDPPIKVHTREERLLHLTEVDDYGQIDTARVADGIARTALVKIATTSMMDRATTLTITLDTGAFEEPPTFTIELNTEGPRLYLHGIAGELAVTLTVCHDGSIRNERH